MANNRKSPHYGGEVSNDLIQVHKDISTRAAIATGLSLAVGVSVLSILGRLTLIHDPKENVLGYLWLLLFVGPFLLTYSERFSAIGGSGGLYGLVRERFGLTLSFLVGWLELGGYATIIVILARMIAIYGLTAYSALGGDIQVNLTFLTAGVILLILLVSLLRLPESRKLATFLVFSSLVLIAGLSIFSLFTYRVNISELPQALKTIRPFKLTALLLSGFWGVIMMYSLRHRIVYRRGDTIVNMGWVVMVAFIVFGGLLALGTVPPTAIGELANVLTVNALTAIIVSGNPVMTMLLGALSVILAFIGMSRGISGGVQVLVTMTDDAFFPKSFAGRFRNSPIIAALAVGALPMILLFFSDTMIIAGMASAFLLAATILIHAPEITLSSPLLPENRPLKLPVHPVFPALSIVVATLALVNLSFDTLKWSGGWFLLGGVFLGAYAYHNALRKRGKENIITAEQQGAHTFGAFVAANSGVPAVLAFVGDFERLPFIIHFGSGIARSVNGRLILMKVVQTSGRLPEDERRRLGKKAWEQLAAAIEDISPLPEDVPIDLMVRLTPELYQGMISAAQELKPRFLLTPPEFVSDDPSKNLRTYDEILRQVASNVIFLNEYPRKNKFSHVTVLIGAGVHASATLLLAKAMVAEDGVIEIVHSLPPGAEEDSEAKRRETILAKLAEIGLDESRVTINILRDAGLEDIVQELVDDADLLILGASKNLMSRRPTFGGVNAQIFQNASIPTLFVSAYEKVRFDWLSKLWETAVQPLPKLTLAEREEVMRDILAGANPSVDFFILILLSSGIAVYGLLQNSGAVIIGAMLVAPLMSPIIAIAMSLVRGDLKNLGLSLQSTTQGILVAISVGAVLTFFSPIKSPTNEILGRVHPNLLDLGIAFLSGAAGGYAMSRKNIAAALPGVAIAAALVPPLTVVGYGFATADLNIAFGALLLFVTNLISIVLAASLVFLALDFLTPEKQTWGDVVRGLKITAVFLVLVIAILGWITYQTVTEQRNLKAINQVLRQSVYSKSFEPLNVEITGSRRGYRIKAMLLSYGAPLSSEELARLNAELRAAVDAPVSADVTMLTAKKESINFEQAMIATQIEESIQAELKEVPLQVLDVEVAQAYDGYEVRLTLIETQPNSFTQEDVQSLESVLQKQFHKPISISAFVVPVKKLEVQASATPEPTVQPSLTSTPVP